MFNSLKPWVGKNSIKNGTYYVNGMNFFIVLLKWYKSMYP